MGCFDCSREICLKLAHFLLRISGQVLGQIKLKKKKKKNKTPGLSHFPDPCNNDSSHSVTVFWFVTHAFRQIFG